MAPMTRTRAIGNIPNKLIATYYKQRASAGLIISEGASPSPNGLGYPRIPGAYSDDQIQGWKNIAEAVHSENGKIFVQLMHTGRITAKLNMPAGSVTLAPSSIQAAGEMFTETGMVADEIGSDKVGIRFSPYGAYNDMLSDYEELENTFIYLSQELTKIKLTYIHIVDQRVAFGAPDFTTNIKKIIKENFKGFVISRGDVDTVEKAEAILDSGLDLVYIGRPFISNPDFVKKLQNKEELISPDTDTFYSADEIGYTDY